MKLYKSSKITWLLFLWILLENDKKCLTNYVKILNLYKNLLHLAFHIKISNIKILMLEEGLGYAYE